MNNIGKIVKIIREEKNIKVESIRTDVMDRGNYWRFENGTISTSADKFLTILENLNIDINEFIELYSTEEMIIFKKMKSDLLKAAKFDDYQLCSKIGTLAKKKYECSKKIKYLHLSELAFLFASRIETNITHNIHAYTPTEIQKYLGQCDTWNYYEIALFNNILFTFQLDDAVLLGNRLIKSLKKKQKTRDIYNEDVLILINLISFCIEENANSLAEKLLKNLLALNISESSTYSRIMFLWIKTIFNIKFHQENKQELDKIYDILKFLGMSETLVMIENWGKKLLQ